MSDNGLEYMPEQFRVSAGLHHEAADGADAVSRRIASVAPAASHFGGSDASGFSGALNSAAGDRTRRADRAGEDRTTIGEGATGAAHHGEEADADAGSHVTLAQTELSRGIANTI